MCWDVFDNGNPVSSLALMRKKRVFWQDGSAICSSTLSLLHILLTDLLFRIAAMDNSGSNARKSEQEKALPEVNRTKDQPEEIQTDKKVNEPVTVIEEATHKSTEADGGDGDDDITSTDLEEIIGRPATEAYVEDSSRTEKTSRENEDRAK
uniref:Uncharacterized protein n=1 Tax=Manihot esculenta TaxID=3983 RepID=A0A199UAH8_MANES